MNLREYISSGVLESYVMGILTEQESAEVEKNIALYPELKEEVTLIEKTNEELLMKAAVTPPPRVKKTVFEKIDLARGEGKIVALQPAENVASWKWAAAASISVAVVASILAFNYYKKWRSSESNLLAITQQNQRIASDYNQVNQRLNRIEDDLKIISDPQFKQVIMLGTPNSPQSTASVYWNSKSEEVYVKIRNMKELARENQYQLWAFIDGKPVDAGVFDWNSEGLVKMKQIGAGAAKFAVTIEPRGGKPTPSVETIQVIGDVAAG